MLRAAEIQINTSATNVGAKSDELRRVTSWKIIAIWKAKSIFPIVHIASLKTSIRPADVWSNSRFCSCGIGPHGQLRRSRRRDYKNLFSPLGLEMGASMISHTTAKSTSSCWKVIFTSSDIYNNYGPFRGEQWLYTLFTSFGLSLCFTGYSANFIRENLSGWRVCECECMCVWCVCILMLILASIKRHVLSLISNHEV